MKTLFHDEIYKGFLIRVYALPEDSAPEDSLPENDCAGIRNGEYLWFMAKVSAFRNGVHLADDYLGGCCYQSSRDFIDPESYYGDMRENVINLANAVIASLSIPEES